MDGLDFIYDYGCSKVQCMEPGGLLRFLYGELLPCRQPLTGLNSDGTSVRYKCIEAHKNFALAFPLGVTEYVEVEHRAFGLGLPHTLLPSRQREVRRPRGAADILDAGSGGMWFFYRRGSGVWFHTGRLKVAPGKNAMLVELLRELSLNPQLDAQWMEVARRQRLFVSADEGATRDLERLDATAAGRKTCMEAGVSRCRDFFVLDDSWDDVLTWAGRALNYDTLFFSATLLPSSRQKSADAIEFVSAYAEMVDLRVPEPSWTILQQQGIHPYLEGDAPLFARRKTTSAADRWLRLMRDSGVLTLRDPLRPTDSTYAKQCNFSLGPTTVLRCSGHAPTRWKALPVGGGWDSCSIAMCGHNDLRW